MNERAPGIPADPARPVSRVVLRDPHITSMTSETVNGVELRFPVIDTESVRRAIPAIRQQARQIFEGLPAEEVQTSMDRVDRWFADVKRPEVADVVELLHRIDGFSKHDIERFGLGIFYPLVRYDRALIGRFVEAAFRTRRPVETAFGYLQRFGANRPFARWREPGLVSHFVSGNVVGYSAILTRIGLPVRREGAAQIVKLPSTSAAFPMIYLAKMAELAPLVRRTMACGYWKGGDRAVEALVLADSDVVNVLSSDETIRDVAERARRLKRGGWLGRRLGSALGVARGRGPRILAHGHKIGAAYVSREFAASPELRRRAIEGLVRDISAFDGAACYSVKNIYVEEAGAGIGARSGHARFAEELADALGRFARDVSPVNQTAMGVARALGRVFMGAANVIAATEGSAYARVADRAAFWLPDETYRYVQVMPVAGAKEVAAVLRAARPFLQTVVAAVPDGEVLDTLDLFGGAGASNVHFPGSAPLLNLYEEPHDGDFDAVKARYPYRARFAATNFKRNADWL